jgi:hypothetical protein
MREMDMPEHTTDVAAFLRIIAGKLDRMEWGEEHIATNISELDEDIDALSQSVGSK